ncbi:MAG: HEAT repeat domain-containing protein [bacterium]
MSVIKHGFTIIVLLFTIALFMGVDNTQSNLTEDDYILMLKLGGINDRREATMKLGDYKSEETVLVLIDALKDPDFTVKKLAIASLAKIGNPRAIEPLTELLSSDDKWIRREASSSLATFGEKAIPYLKEVCESEKPWVREEALRALIQIASPDTMEIFKYMSQNTDPEVRILAIGGLAKLGKKDSIPTLVNLLREPEPTQRSAAEEALIAIGSPALEFLTNYINDPDVNLRQSLARIFGRIQNQETIPSLITLLGDSWPQVRDEAIYSLFSKGEDTILYLIEALTSDNPKIISSVIKILGELKYRPAIEKIAPYLSAQDDNVRANAVLSLGKLNAYDLKSRIAELYNDRASTVRSSVALALGFLGGSDVFEILSTMWSREKDEVVKRSICIALGMLKSDEGISVLEKAIKEKDHVVRLEAVKALGKIGSPACVNPLKKARFDDEEEVLSAVYEALKKIGTPEALEALRR